MGRFLFGRFMTTDVATLEAPAVETELTTTELEAAPAPEIPEAPVIDEGLEAFFKEEGLVDGERASTSEVTEAGDLPPEVQARVELEVEKVKRSTEEKRTQQERENYVSGVRNAKAQSRSKIITAMQNAAVPLDVQTFIAQEYDTIEGHYKVLSDYDAGAHHNNVLSAMRNKVYEDAAELLPQSERKGFTDRAADRFSKGEESTAALLKDYRETVRKGLFTPQQVNEKAKQAVQKYHAKVVQYLPGGTAAEVGSTAAGGGGRHDYAWFNNLPVDEQMKVSADERARIYQEDSTRRSRA